MNIMNKYTDTLISDDKGTVKLSYSNVISVFEILPYSGNLC